MNRMLHIIIILFFPFFFFAVNFWLNECFHSKFAFLPGNNANLHHQSTLRLRCITWGAFKYIPIVSWWEKVSFIYRGMLRLGRFFSSVLGIGEILFSSHNKENTAPVVPEMNHQYFINSSKALLHHYVICIMQALWLLWRPRDSSGLFKKTLVLTSLSHMLFTCCLKPELHVVGKKKEKTVLFINNAADKRSQRSRRMCWRERELR